MVIGLKQKRSFVILFWARSTRNRQIKIPLSSAGSTENRHSNLEEATLNKWCGD